MPSIKICRCGRWNVELWPLSTVLMFERRSFDITCGASLSRAGMNPVASNERTPCGRIRNFSPRRLSTSGERSLQGNPPVVEVLPRDLDHLISHTFFASSPHSLRFDHQRILGGEEAVQGLLGRCEDEIQILGPAPDVDEPCSSSMPGATSAAMTAASGRRLSRRAQLARAGAEVEDGREWTEPTDGLVQVGQAFAGVASYLRHAALVCPLLLRTVLRRSGSPSLAGLGWQADVGVHEGLEGGESR